MATAHQAFAVALKASKDNTSDSGSGSLHDLHPSHFASVPSPTHSVQNFPADENDDPEARPPRPEPPAAPKPISRNDKWLRASNVVRVTLAQRQDKEGAKARRKQGYNKQKAALRKTATAPSKLLGGGK